SVEGLLWVPERLEMNALALAQRVDVGKRRLKLNARMPRLRSDMMDRDEAVTLPDDPLQANRDLCVWLKPPGYCPRHALESPIGLANVLRQDCVLIGNLWIEERHVRCLALGP